MQVLNQNKNSQRLVGLVLMHVYSDIEIDINEINVC